MSKKSDWAERMAAQAKSGVQSVDRFAKFEAMAGLATPAASNLPVKRLRLDEILPNPAPLREINDLHTFELALSISVVGMLQFPIVDATHRLVAGNHRVAAVKLLQDVANQSAAEVRAKCARFESPDAERLADEDFERLAKAFGEHFSDGMLVHLLPDEQHGADFLTSIQAIENDLRRDFTKVELQQLVERFRAAGYDESAGRPNPGTKKLSAELLKVTGKSRSTILRLLNSLDAPPPVEADPARELQTALSAALKLKVQVRGGDEKGAITLHYKTPEERASLLRRLQQQ